MSTENVSRTACNWFEVCSPNVASAVKFYEAVFGWTGVGYPMGETTYHMLQKGDLAFAGVMDLNHESMQGVPPHWGLYFHTESCQGSIDKAKELGAELVYGPMDIPDIGTVAGFKDCCGAFFNVHEPAGERQDISNGGVNWVEHMGPNRESAVSFYKSLFGWGSMDMDMGEPVGIYSMLTIGEMPIAGAMQVGESMGVPPNWTIYLHSDKLEDTIEKITANGGSIMQPPMDIGEFGRIAIAADCCGAVFGLHQPPAGM